jgi:hypothetical protein
MWDIFLGATLGAITSMATAVAVENWRRPRLKLSIEAPSLDWIYQPDAPAHHVRDLRVMLLNQQLLGWSKWMVRSPALQCRATISFHHLDGQNVFGRVNGRTMGGLPATSIIARDRSRWASFY